MESFDRVSFRTCSVLLFIILLIESVGGAVYSPIIQVVSDNSISVVFQCKSEGWYPEPEVFWLDGEGNLLSAGPTETVRGPDDLYTVSSRVTVEKRHSNSFTCRVQQKDINQTRETHIQVTAGFFMDQSSLIGIGIFTIVVYSPVLLLFILILTRKHSHFQMFSTKPRNRGEAGERKERADQRRKEKRDVEKTIQLWKTEKKLKNKHDIIKEKKGKEQSESGEDRGTEEDTSVSEDDGQK
ncbi:butyrophilin subfamily 2 member A2-like [Micropterus dolomieu]|uniref:butyrophilin subfamily 2 member A2-like n=1 Tax=Micropterus dolomieu TaxID=147949 RepID=UPI001E8E7E6E|nr:butyrophilin subfamily 2 member A2-like [Micropterus dolomieu]